VLRQESELARVRPELAERRASPPSPSTERSVALLRAEADMDAAHGSSPSRGEHDRLLAEHQQLRAEHQQLHAEHARLERELAEQRNRSARVYEGLEQLRREVAGLRAGSAQPGPAAGQVEAERLSAALSRLREATPPAHDEPRRGRRLGHPFRALASRLRRRGG
jgi:chromosome segregation ATPase